jgi:hypothetical protein
MKPSLILALLGFLSLCVTSPCDAQEKKDKWLELIDAAEELFGKDGIAFKEKGDSKLEAIVDFHAKHSAGILGKPISSERVFIVKQAFRLLRETASDRYRGDLRSSFFRAMRHISSNRALFFELLQSHSSAEVIQEQLLAYVTSTETQSYQKPVSLKPEQLLVEETESPIRIVSNGIRMHSDRGTVGNSNGAIDSGETIVLNIPLKNVSNDPFRSTSVFLTSDDEFVTAEVSEVVYSGRKTIGGETVSFAPNTIVTPRDTFTFSISPTCPDLHVVRFDLVAWDSDRGKFRIPFAIKVFKVGPLDFGESSIDDDVPGLSDGDGNRLMEPGETVEYVLRVKNAGRASVENVSATLSVESESFQFMDGMDQLRYAMIAPTTEKPVCSSFVFKLSRDDESFQPHAFFRLFVTGDSRECRYAWVQTRSHPIGVSNEYWGSVVRQANIFIKRGQHFQAMVLLDDPKLVYRIDSNEGVKKLLNSVREDRRDVDFNAAKYNLEKRLVCDVCRGTGICPNCHGDGYIILPVEKCPRCKGRRKIMESSKGSKWLTRCPECAGLGRYYPHRRCGAKHCDRGKCSRCKGTGRKGKLLLELGLCELVGYFPKDVLPERVGRSVAKQWRGNAKLDQGNYQYRISMESVEGEDGKGSRMRWNVAVDDKDVVSSGDLEWGEFQCSAPPFRLVVFEVEGNRESSRGAMESYLDAMLISEPIPALMWETFDRKGAWSSSNDSTCRWTVANGVYRVARSSSGGWASRTRSTKLSDDLDYLISFDIRQVEGENGAAGVVWGFNSDNKHFLYAFLHRDHVSLGYHDDDGYHSRRNRNIDLRKAGEFNSFKVTKRCDDIVLWVNGKSVATIAEQSFYGNRFGFMVEKNQIVEFDNLLVSSFSGKKKE